MKHIYLFNRKPLNYLIASALTCMISFCGQLAVGQTCPSGITSISTYPNTYYPGQSSSVAAGATSLTVTAAAFGATPITKGDVLLIIQMQGVQIVATNSPAYGTGSGVSGSGYINNAKFLVGNMEYVVANNNVPIGGGTLNLTTGLIHKYQSSAYDTVTNGQYTYQIIRVPVYDILKLTGTITAPAWNGYSGGVLVLYAVDSILFNGQTLSASGMGFRGGGWTAFSGASGTNADFITLATNKTNAPKGEGIAGTPRYLFANGLSKDNGVEGYPGGSFARGAPGNAGGGGTDGNPGSNDQNTGGGGGGNGGPGGGGGNGWSSASTTGGRGGAMYAEVTPSAFVLGGGGGSGTTNNGTGTPSGGWASSGASGGGIVIAMANAFSGTGTVDVSGLSANSTVLNDGSGGGGAGGTALLFSTTGAGLSNITVNANGGNGGTNTGSGAMHGPGGGGGGGVIFSNGTLNAASSATGGVAGTTFSGSNYGASTGTSGTVTQNITAASKAAFPLNCSVLSVEFLSITAQQQNGHVSVNWTVANEVNTSGYVVEKSLDGKTFTPVTTIAYAGAGAVNHYESTDNNGISTAQVIYYRVKEIEFSGKYEYSWIVNVSAAAPETKLSVYPNPVNHSATISFTSTAQSNISLKLVDLKGSLLWQTEYQANIGSNTLPLSVTGSLPDGLYFLQYVDGQKQQIIKLLVKH